MSKILPSWQNLPKSRQMVKIRQKMAKTPLQIPSKINLQTNSRTQLVKNPKIVAQTLTNNLLNKTKRAASSLVLAAFSEDRTRKKILPKQILILEATPQE